MIGVGYKIKIGYRIGVGYRILEYDKGYYCSRIKYRSRI